MALAAGGVDGVGELCAILRCPLEWGNSWSQLLRRDVGG